MLQFRGSVVTSNAGSPIANSTTRLVSARWQAKNSRMRETDKNGRHALVGMLRQSVFGRLAGYEDVNDAERRRHDPAMRWIVGGRAALASAVSPSQIVTLRSSSALAEKDPARRFVRREIMVAPARDFERYSALY